MITKKIFIVDDEVDLGKVCGDILKRIGYDVHLFSSAEAALHQFTPDIDLLITDLNIAGVSGQSLAQEFCRVFTSNKLPPSPVLFISGSFVQRPHNVEDNKKRFYYLEKPFQADDLLLMVDQIIQIKSAVA